MTKELKEEKLVTPDIDEKPKKKRGRPKKLVEDKKEKVDLKDKTSVKKSIDELKSTILEEKIESMAKNLKDEEIELSKSLVASRIHRSILEKIKDLVALNEVAYLIRGNIGKINESEDNLEMFSLEKFLNEQLDIFNKKSNGFVFPEVKEFIDKIKKDG